jgi:hypothetical protein
MQIEVLVGLRNLAVFGILAAAALLQPEISFAVTRPFVTFWRRLQLFRTSIMTRFRSSNKEPFWEIDMTKFEP